MKKRFLWCLKVVLFISILIATLSFLTELMRPKTDETTINKSYYQTPKNSHDVVCFGTSVMLNAFQPMMLWEQFGITSYNMASGGQDIAYAYYLLKDVMKHDQPELVIVDLNRITSNINKHRTNEAHYVIDSMPMWSLAKYQMIYDIIDPSHWSEFIFPLELYHNQWASMTWKDFQGGINDISYGAKVEVVKKPEVEEFEELDVGAIDFNTDAMKYVERIKELCDENGADLLLTMMPILGKDNSTQQDDYDIRKSASIQFEKIAKEKGYDYLNLFSSKEELGLIPQEDTPDGKHLNVFGAEKVMRYLGEYITTHYSIESKKDDPNYQYMNEDYEKYVSLIKEKRVIMNNDFDESIDSIRDVIGDERYVVVVSNRNTLGESWDEQMEEKIRSLGIDLELSEETPNFGAIISNNQVLVEQSSSVSNDIYLYQLVKNTPVVVAVNPLTNNAYSAIVNNTNYNIDFPGLSIVVYDVIDDEFVGTVVYDLNNDCFAMHRNY